MGQLHKRLRDRRHFAAERPKPRNGRHKPHEPEKPPVPAEQVPEEKTPSDGAP